MEDDRIDFSNVSTHMQTQLGIDKIDTMPQYQLYWLAMTLSNWAKDPSNTYLVDKSFEGLEPYNSIRTKIYIYDRFFLKKVIKRALNYVNRPDVIMLRELIENNMLRYSFYVTSYQSSESQGKLATNSVGVRSTLKGVPVIFGRDLFLNPPPNLDEGKRNDVLRSEDGVNTVRKQSIYDRYMSQMWATNPTQTVRNQIQYSDQQSAKESLRHYVEALTDVLKNTANLSKYSFSSYALPTFSGSYWKKQNNFQLLSIPP